jgi:hypothetical protein
MKPLLRMRLYDEFGEVCAENESTTATDLWGLMRSVDFTRGTLRATYDKGVYNEASFDTPGQAKALSALFCEKSLLSYLFSKEL